MISAQEDVGDRLSEELGRPRVERVPQKTVLERVVFVALWVAQHSRKESCDGIGDHESGQFASCDDEVSDRERVRAQLCPDAFVEALVVATDEDEPRTSGELTGMPLAEGHARRMEERDSRLASRLRASPDRF